VVTLFPDDDPVGNACGCAAPACVSGEFTWGVCEGESCSEAGEVLPCG